MKLPRFWRHREDQLHRVRIVLDGHVGRVKGCLLDLFRNLVCSTYPLHSGSMLRAGKPAMGPAWARTRRLPTSKFEVRPTRTAKACGRESAGKDETKGKQDPQSKTTELRKSKFWEKGGSQPPSAEAATQTWLGQPRFSNTDSTLWTEPSRTWVMLDQQTLPSLTRSR